MEVNTSTKRVKLLLNTETKCVNKTTYEMPGICNNNKIEWEKEIKIRV